MSAEDIQAPAIVTDEHRRDRTLSIEAGAPKAYRRVDGLDLLAEQGHIASHQIEAGRRLQNDYAISQMEGGARSTGERTNGSRRSWDIPDNALEAGRKVSEALAVLTPEILSMTVLFLMPNHKDEAPTFENIAARVKEDKRAIKLGVRTALSLLARHYGN